ncbi:MAG TPA: hypothetical protein VLX89_11275 [Actinomycetota bacterium]|nr:hypothetical protein [Actinomycetota bacterium]
MDDSFSLGEPARKRPLPKARPVRGPSGSRPGSRTLALVVGLCALLVVVAIVGFMTLMHRGGEAIGAANATAVAQIGTAQDVQAQLAAHEAVSAAQQLYAESGSFQGIDPGAMKAFEPTFTYTAAPSTGPDVVSVAASGGGVGIAVRSASGTCFYAFDAGSTVRYGTGTACSGQAASSASASSWPNA